MKTTRQVSRRSFIRWLVLARLVLSMRYAMPWGSLSSMRLVPCACASRAWHRIASPTRLPHLGTRSRVWDPFLFLILPLVLSCLVFLPPPLSCLFCPAAASASEMH
ncbi:hypothetical protein J3F84DRAFT_381548 [Trichoderma pleuroticola]